ncbi:MAG: HEAT repeat domain-containing protein [Planctomycetia bacterium]|nr:HEAT repeat domain-containing protein [Planctomycetia bacterium]
MATVTQLAADLCSGDQVKAYQAQQSLAKLTGEIGGSGKEAERAATAKELAAALAALKPAKDGRGEPTESSINSVVGATEICRALAFVAGEAETAILKECLKNIDLREPARWCLARMTCQGATDALVEALTNATGTEYRVGLINGLGRKSGSAVVEALKTAVKSNEPEVRLAAAEALAEQPQADLDAVIATVDSGSLQRNEARIARARVRLGNTLLRAGDKAGAKKVFTSIAGSSADEPQKKAATAALATIG